MAVRSVCVAALVGLFAEVAASPEVVASQQMAVAQGVPSWCKDVPAQFRGVACRGSSAAGCTCSNFCKDTSKDSWANNPECCGCDSASRAGDGSKPSMAPVASQQMAAVQGVPSWCQYVPTTFQSAACRGSSGAGCTCSNFCKDTSKDSWSNNPECCGCGAASPAGKATSPQAFLAPRQMVVAQGVPSWCHYVPAEFQGVACRGSSAAGCTCSNFCKDTSKDSWSNNPECCGCVGDNSTAKPADNVTSPEAQNASQQMVAVQGVPSWCQYVPTQFQSAACRGSNASGCTCSSFCKDTPAESWSNNPQCCGCGASDSKSTPSNNSASPKALVATQQMSMVQGVPSWCHYVPAEFQGAACRGSSAGGCTCSNFCKDTSKDSWSNNPECCGCGK